MKEIYLCLTCTIIVFLLVGNGVNGSLVNSPVVPEILKVLKAEKLLLIDEVPLTDSSMHAWTQTFGPVGFIEVLILNRAFCCILIKLLLPSSEEYR